MSFLLHFYLFIVSTYRSGKENEDQVYSIRHIANGNNEHPMKRNNYYISI